ncbi:ribonuclease H family protein [Aspergillus nidulans FGSC A4]|uniref:RNase H type-1 domain-containing protein n=1 Tax=Emericella nidulans (strain FGSC A4 / ATCC 38163 / CBS 112.46 / NRRL 194 / M139) TaxID=227321 RepID=C8V7Z8_EMENI|nr:hypothetical protein [Aspergillus nidulans FGSC A4]CBF76131.1 TPA: hypothetical protein ANIA_10625 [Aspergillus nidulans FGSC A4]
MSLPAVPEAYIPRDPSTLSIPQATGGEAEPLICELSSPQKRQSKSKPQQQELSPALSGPRHLRGLTSRHTYSQSNALGEKDDSDILWFHTGTAMDMVERVRRGEDIGNGHLGNGWRPWSWSPLEKIQDFTEREIGKDSLRNLEQILPFSVAPHWVSPDIIIDGDAETAIETHRNILNRAPRPIALYTDGSGINGRVGAAAICPKYLISRSSYMGQQSESTVYVAELQGILLALVIILQRQMQHAVIFTDNQATLQALRNPGSQSGQYILEAIIMALNKGRKAGLNVHFRWIPAHRGVEGNEQADRRAKEATGWRRIRGHRGRMTIRSAVKRRAHEVVNARWENDWKSCHHGRELYELTPTPTRKVLRVHQDLHRALSTIIVQMRTGKIGLRHYLYQRGVPDVPNSDCQCGRATQSVRHILLACPTFSGLREEIFGGRSGGPEGEGSVKKIFNTPKLAIQAAKFMLRTGLLGQFGAVRRAEIDEAEH